ncbi:hypothetical protein WJ438_18350 [Streptomyces sp. GD-15H]|uniref:hypothetical protein n=1 Tax=Streptomyces sp. GD-15H TaxID=3129112 RepID=UPI00324664BA
MLPPSAIAGVSLVCALGPWVFTQPMTLRLLAAAAAATAIVGAVVMRHWDTLAGKQVADLTRARASDEWRFEERVAELEADLDESRELRAKLEQRLRVKRAELAGLRSEHAALLRRYAAAQTERANVLEERRVLEIEAAVPARALPVGPSARSGDETAGTASVPAARSADGTAVEERIGAAAVEAEPTAAAVFSPEGSKLFLRAGAALARLAADSEGEGDEGEGDDRPAQDVPDADATDTEADDAQGKHHGTPEGDFPEDDGPEPTKKRKPEQSQKDGAEEQPGAVGEHERAASSGPDTDIAPEAPSQPEQLAPPGRSVQPPGHFTVPTAVAVVPPTEPARRPVTDGGFDFFGTQKAEEGTGPESVQNEDLADGVGQEAPAPHKAEGDAEFEPTGEDARAVGQVIDLTAHDEPEEGGAGGTADVAGTEGLRSAVS